jgi:mevalonate kinase
MYITTQKGTLIPITSIKAVKETNDGSLIIVKTGEKVKDPRTPVEVFKEAYSVTPDIEPIVTSFGELVEEVKTFRSNMANNLSALTTVLQEVTVDVKASTKTLTRNGTAAREATDLAKRSHKEVNILIGNLNDAIQEI